MANKTLVGIVEPHAYFTQSGDIYICRIRALTTVIIFYIKGENEFPCV